MLLLLHLCDSSDYTSVDLIGECNRDQRSHLPSSKSEGAARNARGPPGVLFYLRKIHRQEQQQ